MEKEENESNGPGPVKSLVVVFSYHHMNTEKIAHVMAKVLDAPVKTPQQVKPEELQEYSLIGFGSGIYSAQNHKSLLDLADNLPQANGRNAFIFSTFGAPAGLFKGERLTEFIHNNHRVLREKLQSRGYTVIDEFACAGFNTNSFLKYFGGLNKGRPDAEDLKHAEEFAGNIKMLAGMEK
jgi:flavodoxin